MKKQLKLIGMFVLSAPLMLQAQHTNVTNSGEKKKYEFARERSMSQSYPVSGSDRLLLSNQFGKIDVKTWAKNEVKVDVHIATSSTVKEANDELFERIEIKHGKDGNQVYFKTEMDNDRNRDKRYKGNQSNSIDINYTVYMPASLSLSVKNKFGKTSLPDLNNRVDIEQQFGDLVAGKLANTGEIEIKFSSASFEGLKDAELDIQFAKSPIVIKNATGSLELNVQHSKQGITVYAEDLSALEVNAQFSDVGIVVPKNASADFAIRTHFGSMNNNTSYAIKGDDEERSEKRYGPKFTHVYKGTAGSGKVKMKLNGNFSDFIISHEAPVFNTKKKKEKAVTI